MSNSEDNGCLNCHLPYKCAFYTSGLSSIKEVNDSLMTFHFKKGQVVCQEGDKKTGIYFVKRGKLKFCRTSNNDQEIILKLMKEGEMIGHSILINENHRAEFSAISMETTQLCYLPYQATKQHLENNVSFLKSISKAYYDDLSHFGFVILNINTKNVRQRIATALLELYRTFGTDAKGNIDIVITREEIAKMSATTTESAIRFMSELKQEEVIQQVYKKIQIVNLPKLQKIAGA